MARLEARRAIGGPPLLVAAKRVLGGSNQPVEAGCAYLVVCG